LQCARQHLILRELDRRGWCGAAEVGRDVEGLGSTASAAMVPKLAKDGLVETRAGRNRNGLPRREYRLSDAGRTALGA